MSTRHLFKMILLYSISAITLLSFSLNVAMGFSFSGVRDRQFIRQYTGIRDFTSQKALAGGETLKHSEMTLNTIEVPLQKDTEKYSLLIKDMMSDKILIRWYISRVDESRNVAIIEAVCMNK